MKTTRNVKWTPEFRKKLITAVMDKPKELSNKDRFKLVQKDFPGMTLPMMQWGYYESLRKFPELAKEVAEELKKPPVENIVAEEPVGTAPEQPVAESVIENPAHEVVAVIDAAEDETLASAGDLIDGLMKLGSVMDISSFFNGLNVIVKKANDVVDQSAAKEKLQDIEILNEKIKELTDEIEKLKQINANHIETLEYVCTIINWFSELPTGQKVSNVKKVTQDLVNSIYSRIKV